MVTRNGRIRELEQCNPTVFGNLILTNQTLPMTNPKIKPATWTTRVRSVSETTKCPESERRRASILVDKLLLEIYSSCHYADYNSSTASTKSHRTRAFVANQLNGKDKVELMSVIGGLESHVARTGGILVRQLKRRDALRRQRDARSDVISYLLRKRVPEFSPELRFSIEPLPGDSGFSQWHSAMKMVSQLPEGIPPEFRKRLWLSLADKHLSAKGIDWSKTERNCFSEWSHPDDSELGVQIVKDLHRTGCSLFCGKDGQENQALLKRVLLAYARWNKAVGYCQGFNMLAALILQVTEKCEADALKLMIYLIEGVLPDSYFADSLRGLSVDMAVFRELLRTKLPRLSRHLDTLQVASKEGTTSYEPPLTNVFTMQWFLTLFCNCLPQPTVLRVWDLILLEGNEILLRTALAIWQVLAERIMTVKSADEFYCMMGVMMREILEFDLINANTLIKGIVTIGPLTELSNLREHYLYNINPWGSAIPVNEDRRMKVYHKDRLVLDIGVLKKQYTKLKQRQRQAHIIFNTAVARQTSRPAPVAMNHLLLGKSALVPAKRLGPPKGAVPPARQPQLQQPKPQPQPQPQPQPPKTLHWKDTRRSSSSSSSSSSDTELCDDPDNPSDEECQLPDDNQSDKDNSDPPVSATPQQPEEVVASAPKDNQTNSDIFDTENNSDLMNQINIRRSDSIQSDDGFDFEKFLEERVQSFKEKQFSSEESLEDTSEQERVKYARKNSVRALEIIQENSLILHRILQCQSRLTPTPPPTDEQVDKDITPTNNFAVSTHALFPYEDNAVFLPENVDSKFISNQEGDSQRNAIDLTKLIQLEETDDVIKSPGNEYQFILNELKLAEGRGELGFNETISDITILSDFPLQSNFNLNDTNVFETELNQVDDKLIYDQQASDKDSNKLSHNFNDKFLIEASSSDEFNILDIKKMEESCEEFIVSVEDAQIELCKNENIFKESTSPHRSYKSLYDNSVLLSKDVIDESVKKLDEIMDDNSSNNEYSMITESNQDFGKTSEDTITTISRKEIKSLTSEELKLQIRKICEEHKTIHVNKETIKTKDESKLSNSNIKTSNEEFQVLDSTSIVATEHSIEERVVDKLSPFKDDEADSEKLSGNAYFSYRTSDNNIIYEDSKILSEDLKFETGLLVGENIEEEISKFRNEDNIYSNDEFMLEAKKSEKVPNSTITNPYQVETDTILPTIYSYEDKYKDNKISREEDYKSEDISYNDDKIFIQDVKPLDNSSKSEDKLHESNTDTKISPELPQYADKYKFQIEDNISNKEIVEKQCKFEYDKKFKESTTPYKFSNEDIKLSSSHSVDVKPFKLSNEEIKLSSPCSDVKTYQYLDMHSALDTSTAAELETIGSKESINKCSDVKTYKYQDMHSELDTSASAESETTGSKESVNKSSDIKTYTYVDMHSDLDTSASAELETIGSKEFVNKCSDVKTYKYLDMHSALDTLASTELEPIGSKESVNKCSDVKTYKFLDMHTALDTSASPELESIESKESVNQFATNIPNIDISSKIEEEFYKFQTQENPVTSKLKCEDILAKNSYEKNYSKIETYGAYKSKLDDELCSTTGYSRFNSKYLTEYDKSSTASNEDFSMYEETEKPIISTQNNNDNDLHQSYLQLSPIKEPVDVSCKDYSNISSVEYENNQNTSDLLNDKTSQIFVESSYSSIVEDELSKFSDFRNSSKIIGEELTKFSESRNAQTSKELLLSSSNINDQSIKEPPDEEYITFTASSSNSKLPHSLISIIETDDMTDTKPSLMLNLKPTIEDSGIEEVDYNLEKYRHKLGSPLVEEPGAELIEIDKNSKYNSILEYSRNLDEKFNNLIMRSSQKSINSKFNYSLDNPEAEKSINPKPSRSFSDLDTLTEDEPSTSKSKYLDNLGESPTLKSPNRIYNPFPVNISTRQNKEVAVRLGLYKK